MPVYIYAISFSLCGGSASIPRRLKVTVHSSGNINDNTENMEDEGKVPLLILSCNESMPHMLVASKQIKYSYKIYYYIVIKLTYFLVAPTVTCHSHSSSLMVLVVEIVID